MGMQDVKKAIENAATYGHGPIDFKVTGIKADTIAESTSAAGVTIDGVLVKDNAVTASGGFTGAITGAVTATTVTASSTLSAAGITTSAGLFIDVGTVAASGSTQANAIADAPITKSFTLVSAADNAKGVALPTGTAGQICIIKSGVSGSTVQVYPQSACAINLLTANTAYNTAANGAVAFVAYNATQWYSIPLAG